MAEGNPDTGEIKKTEIRTWDVDGRGVARVAGGALLGTIGVIALVLAVRGFDDEIFNYLTYNEHGFGSTDGFNDMIAKVKEGNRLQDFITWLGSNTNTLAETVPEVTVETPEPGQTTNTFVQEKPVETVLTTTDTAASCGCDDEKEVIPVEETTCTVFPEGNDAFVATADSKCDGIISLTREALWGNHDFVTAEMVASIENPEVKAVYQALLNDDRTAFTEALTKLYTENGYFIPGNASGALDGLKDSIVIHPGDHIVVNEDGWFLKRAGGEEIKMVSSCGELLSVGKEIMSDTGSCGDTPKVVRGASAPIIPVETEMIPPIEPEIDCLYRFSINPQDGSVMEVKLYDDINSNGTAQPNELREVKSARHCFSDPTVFADAVAQTNGDLFYDSRDGKYKLKSAVEIIESGSFGRGRG